MTTEAPFPSSVELMLRIHAPLIDARQANSLAIEAAVAAMAPATKAAITADLKCYLGWCWSRHPRITDIPAAPETLVHYLRWLEKGSDTRAPAKAATLARRIASIARMHRILGFGEKEPLPTKAGMVRDTLKGMRRNIGEGFDDARLDTLFLTMPISWKGTLAQYVGRLHRQRVGKTNVLVVDYVDGAVPVLGRMAARRRAGYRGLGYLFE